MKRFSSATMMIGLVAATARSFEFKGIGLGVEISGLVGFGGGSGGRDVFRAVNFTRLFSLG